VDLQCTSTPGCNLEELLRQLEEPMSPTFRLADTVSTKSSSESSATFQGAVLLVKCLSPLIQCHSNTGI